MQESFWNDKRFHCFQALVIFWGGSCRALRIWLSLRLCHISNVLLINYPCIRTAQSIWISLHVVVFGIDTFYVLNFSNAKVLLFECSRWPFWTKGSQSIHRSSKILRRRTVGAIFWRDPVCPRSPSLDNGIWCHWTWASNARCGNLILKWHTEP